ncbi:MAG: ribonucleoside triphosphate reductase [Candidatus Magasanikbacteria bacterium CG10_big_fil_rev_8_21_14_0_10_47_10]|uniref:Ribonucleoside triphosphate reductase n=1 Tax=Candidatus Magasanikbacteria bacterium CG10_big_fil_rev_8_21_14_0_10_47_10 TaxID=1974652 RepID=A0A2H0TRJ5_9BACT|nr:MAG: ribonucleoside triphosphate reductase [Candidatus Magasanikbacteria bacterium CG10_big_fil_rev_8_21_14_0_10_47_10]
MPLYKIQKRNGEVVDFDSRKIERALHAALKATHSGDHSAAFVLTQDVLVQGNDMFPDRIPSVEEIQDLVEQVLIQAGYATTAKAYILYRAKREERRQDRNVVVDVEKTIDEYLQKLDWRVNANSNQGYSLGGMILNTAGKVTANYWLSHVYPQGIGDAHRNADVHIHDLDMLSGYCAGWSLRALLEEGFNGVSNKIESGPPKHLSSAVAQMVNFLGTLQNEWAGAQAFSSFDTYMAPFVKKFEMELRNSLADDGIRFATPDALETYVHNQVYEYVHQNIQSFVFNMNIPSRWGTQTPFTNITLDWICPEDLKAKRLILGGKEFEYSFGELQKEMDMVNKAFIEVMTKGDAKGRTFTFPIPTYNITKDFDWNDPKTIPLFEMTAKYGTPYFQNFLNSDLNPGDVRSMCCRLQLDLKELKKRGGGLFGSAEMTGSLGVVTINMARIGYLYRGDKEQFIERVSYLMELAKTSLEIKRKEIQKWIDRGLFPYTKRYLGYLRNHFSTVGVNGLNEAIRNFTADKHDITSEWGHAFAEEILDMMRDKLQQFQEETGNMYNLEATPAEGTTYRFAKEDKKRFADILQAGTDESPYYTNSSQIPVGYTDDLFEALDLQDSLQTKYTGGTVFHCYMSERISSPEMCRDLVRKVLSRYRLPYITITPTFSICPKHGYLAGEFDYCPRCDEENGTSGERFEMAIRVPHMEIVKQA